ncbi:MAG: methylglyoxal synthase [Chitinophagaceae bacterium]
MITNRKIDVVKRIAFVASDNNRKSLIEWSYDNQEVLKHHELIAAGTMADILEGTIGVPVTRLHDGASAGNEQLATRITAQQIDILVFFWDAVQPPQYESGVRALYDMAVAGNIIIAANQATADFVLSSQLMNKTHSVPVLPAIQRVRTGTYYNTDASRQAFLKLNTIN